MKVIGKVLQRAGLKPSDVALWEINEAFASVPIAPCREYGLDEELVNFSGSGCSLGHPIVASGARMVTTLVYELQRRGGGIGVAAMCAGGGQGGRHRGLVFWRADAKGPLDRRVGGLLRLLAEKI